MWFFSKNKNQKLNEITTKNEKLNEKLNEITIQNEKELKKLEKQFNEKINEITIKNENLQKQLNEIKRKNENNEKIINSLISLTSSHLKYSINKFNGKYTDDILDEIGNDIDFISKLI